MNTTWKKQPLNERAERVLACVPSDQWIDSTQIAKLARISPVVKAYNSLLTLMARGLVERKPNGAHHVYRRIA